MKTDIFKKAIKKRNNLRFLYGIEVINLEPYYIARNDSGKKVIYGRMSNTNIIRKFEYNKIANIKVIESIRFSPRIPINSYAV